MATYLIGDVQGCLDELQHLLDKIQYEPKHDCLGFVGDLVNRGPKSLATLRFIKSLNNTEIVLGNHDLHCIALCYGVIERDNHHDLQSIAHASDCDELMHWLRQQPLMRINAQQHYALVHAGVAPQWSLEQALEHADEVQQWLAGDDYMSLLQNMYGDQPDEWHDTLSGWARLRYIINAFTRMRFCSQSGKLDLSNKTNQSSDPTVFKPWFEWQTPSIDVVFGHWAALEGKCNQPGYFAIDTGCVWGKQLTALCIETRQLITVNAHAPCQQN